MSKFRILIDMDGVLCDWERKYCVDAKRYTGYRIWKKQIVATFTLRTYLSYKTGYSLKCYNL